MIKGVGSIVNMNCRYLREDLFIKIYLWRARLLTVALVFFILFVAGVVAPAFLWLTVPDENSVLLREWLIRYKPYALVCVTVAVTLMLLYIAAMEKMAKKDSLTGLYNKMCIQERVEKEITSLGETNSPAAMIMVDLDNFKNVNNLMGHLFGDAVLVSVAQTLRGIFAGNSLLGRVGGDEFVVFLPGADINTAQKMAEEACRALSSLHRNYLALLPFSVSIGVALFPQQGKSFPDLYNKADIALYHSKNCGKARCQFYEESMGLSFPQMESYAEIASFTAYNFPRRGRRE